MYVFIGYLRLDTELLKGFLGCAPGCSPGAQGLDPPLILFQVSKFQQRRSPRTLTSSKCARFSTVSVITPSSVALAKCLE